mgnify:CR=1 FL=1
MQHVDDVESFLNECVELRMAAVDNVDETPHGMNMDMLLARGSADTDGSDCVRLHLVARGGARPCVVCGVVVVEN